MIFRMHGGVIFHLSDAHGSGGKVALYNTAKGRLYRVTVLLAR